VAGDNFLKRKLLNRERVLGCFLLTGSSDNAEVLAHAGFDFLFIDHEHGSGSRGDAIAQMRAMKGTPTASMLRIPSLDPGYIKRVLDAGVQCILCPMIESASAAKAVVEACWFPPYGARGAGGATRASAYGYDADFANRVQDELLIAVQIESVNGIEQIEEIAAVAGIDLLFLGPRDLSASIGKLGRFEDPEVLAIVARAEAAILRSGKRLGSVVYPGRTPAQMFERGYDLLIGGSDIGFLVEGARRAILAGPTHWKEIVDERNHTKPSE
jgi:4-hydroxy-2-oxoheptanedioate aldolase